MKYVLEYRSTPESRASATTHFPEHQAWYEGFHARGLLLMVGRFTDGDGEAIGVFTTRDAAEEFAAGDPFVRHGVVASWKIREWREVLVP